MSYLATLWYWLVFVVTAPLVFIVAVIVWGVTAPFDPDRHLLHALVCRLCFQYLRVWPGWRLSVEGRERIPPGACVLVANHQSVADIFAAMGLFRPFKFVSKGSLFRIPVIGWTMTMLRYVRVERGSPQSMRAMLDRCERWLAEGVPVLLFPEGTYGEGGELLPFKRGPFRLAREAAVPVVPIVLSGTDQLIKGDGPLFAARARVRIIVLEPVPPPREESEETRVAETVRQRISERLDRERGASSRSQRG